MRKIKSILICTLLITTLTIASYDLNVEATPGGGDDENMLLDYGFIYNKTKALSDVIRTVEDYGLDKGRYFASAGERYAAGEIADWMTEIGLYDPCSNPELSYREQMQNIEYDASS